MTFYNLLNMTADQKSVLDITSRTNTLLVEIATVLNHGWPSEITAAISAVSGLKAVRIADSIAILFTHYRWEEMRMLLRALTETIINAAYLRTASQDEITNYLEFDNAKTWRYAQKLEQLMKKTGGSTVVNSQLRSEVQKRADESAAKMTRDPKKPSWSAYTPHERAEYADRANCGDDFLSLKVATWDLCHNHVHSTFSSHADCVSWLETGAFPEGPERIDDAMKTMHGVNHALWTYCKHLNSTYGLRFGDRVFELADLNARQFRSRTSDSSEVGPVAQT